MLRGDSASTTVSSLRCYKNYEAASPINKNKQPARRSVNLAAPVYIFTSPVGAISMQRPGGTPAGSFGFGGKQEGVRKREGGGECRCSLAGHRFPISECPAHPPLVLLTHSAMSPGRGGAGHWCDSTVTLTACPAPPPCVSVRGLRGTSKALS